MHKPGTSGHSIPPKVARTGHHPLYAGWLDMLGGKMHALQETLVPKRHPLHLHAAYMIPLKAYVPSLLITWYLP